MGRGLVDNDGARALLWYLAAALVMASGVALAALRFPGGFDWGYTVISRLGSHRHNPEGAAWLAGSLLLTVALLWPVARHVGRISAPDRASPRVSTAALRLGLVGGALLGLEGLLALDLARLARKSHEVLALVTFAALYWGVLGLHLHRVRHVRAALWPALLVMVPLVAVGLSQLTLYFDQRDLGWVNTGWRELGVPLWLSFAFWQWLAVALLGLGLGSLIAAPGPQRSEPVAEAGG